jgi:uncharacterized LabA/DUF88 family protein
MAQLSKPKKKRAAVFIDAANFYRGLKGAGVHANQIDPGAVARKLVLDRELVGVYYYTIRFDDTAPSNLREQNRQILARLERDPLIKVVTGHIQTITAENPLAVEIKRYLANLRSVRLPEIVFKDLVRMADAKMSVPVHREKGVDVALACDMVRFAKEELYDVAFLVSGDADFVPAINIVRSYGQRVFVAHPDAANRLIIACDQPIKLEPAWFGDCRWAK